jgi:hypothetical protein
MGAPKQNVETYFAFQNSREENVQKTWLKACRSMPAMVTTDFYPFVYTIQVTLHINITLQLCHNI